MSDTSSITGLLQEWSRGDRAALDELTRTVYDELHAIARRYLNRGGNHTLQPTALINETYLRLIDQSRPVAWQSRAHFFGIAARLMRLVLVDRARARAAEKRGGGATPVVIETLTVGPNQQSPDILDLNDSLERLAQLDRRKAELIEMRYFAGMSREEMGCATGLTIATVKRELRLGEAWLRRDLLRSPDAET